MAHAVSQRWPSRTLRIADVAGGKGYLNAELHRLGYRNVVTFDRRKDRWTCRPHYRYAYFTADTEPGFELLLGLHPDGATDHVIDYAARWRVPFAIVPCCIIPSAFPYSGPRKRPEWEGHLKALAERFGFAVAETKLPIRGARTLLVGSPERSESRG